MSEFGGETYAKLVSRTGHDRACDRGLTCCVGGRPASQGAGRPGCQASLRLERTYIGGHIGYLWGRTRVEEDGEVTEPNASTNGTIGGVLAGYNWQRGPAVFGLEGDFGWTNAHGTGTTLPPPPIVVTTQAPNTYDVNWNAHIRGRAGYAFDNWLLFIAGGLAVADFEFHEGAITTTTIPGPPGGKFYGWSIGGGAEVAFTRNLVGRVEYLYDDYGHKDYTGLTGDPYRVSFRAQTVRGALAWKFDPFGMRP